MSYIKRFVIGFAVSLICSMTTPGAIAAPQTAADLPAQDFATTLQTSAGAIKLMVNREAWYRVTGRELFAAGLSRRVTVGNLQLWAEGVEIPVAISRLKDGQIDDQSMLEFYGKGLDSPASAVRVFWLMAGARPGKRLATLSGEGRSAAGSSFLRSVEHRDRTTYLSTLLNGEAENFFGAVISDSTVSQTLNLCHLAASDIQPPALEVTMQGVTQRPHQVQVQFNGYALGKINLMGQQNRHVAFTLRREWLVEGANSVGLTSVNGAGDINLLDRIRITYQHTFAADQNRLDFTIAEGERVQIGGFTVNAIRVFDVTDSDCVRELAGKIAAQADGSYSITVTAPEGGARRLLALASEEVARPLAIKADRKSRWRETENGADLLLITRRDFFSQFSRLKALREREGLSVALVDIEDIYDEFNYGNKSPQSLKAFIYFAHTSWQVKPRFVLLAGDASVDAKNYLGNGDYDLVPTKLIDTKFMEAASDDWFADFTGDGTSELAIGRLPVRSVKEAEIIVNKLLVYATTRPLESALTVADASDGYDFEGGSAEVAEILQANLKVEELRRGRLTANEAKARLLAAFNSGQKLVNYLGHGSLDQWRGSLLTAAEARQLTNQTLPVLVMMTCLNGYFNDAAEDSLGESLLKAEGGGAIAVWASSAMASSPEQALINKALYRILFDGRNQGIRFGEAIRQSKQAIANEDIRRTWILLGDPTLLIK